MLKSSIIINCSNCKEKRCLRFSQSELETPDFIKDFPSASYDDVCLADALSYKNGNIIIAHDKCINCGLCATRCTKIKINSIKPDLTDYAISEFFRSINKLKRRDSNFPNLIVRNVLLCLGYRASILKKGVISIRTDLVGTEFIGEIEFGEDILETPRSILDDVAVLKSRYNIDFKKIKTLIFIDKLPHIRSEIWEVIGDIKKITGIQIETITLLYLFLRIWNGKKLLTDDGKIDFYIDKSSTDYRNGIYMKYMPYTNISKLSEREEIDIMSQSN